jgi:dipeptidyl-peptidase-4
VTERGDSTISFPRQYARTQRFTLGHPRSFSVAADGSRVAFLRSPGGEDPMTCLWVLDVETRRERLVADPRVVLGEANEHLSDQERARRERARETAGGIVAYAGDRDLRVAAFALGGRLFLADLVDGEVRELSVATPVFDPRPDPTGRRVVYVSDGALRCVDVDGADRLLIDDQDPDVTWGMAEFVAAEEMERHRGFWWAPDGESVAAARVDNRPVPVWHIADPSEPSRPPHPVRYPAAGTNDADVSLSILGVDGSRVDVAWDRQAFPYLVSVGWQRDRPLTLLVESRDQNRWQVLTADERSGATTRVFEDRSDTWLEIVTGVPSWTDDGGLVFVREMDDTRHLTIDGEPVTPAGLQVARVVHVAAEVIVTGTQGEPMEQHLWRVAASGTTTRLTEPPGVHEGVAGADVLVLSSSSMERDHAEVKVLRGDAEVCTIGSNAATPVITPAATLLKAGPHELRTVVLFPDGRPPESPLPVLLDPYGGPHFQRVVAARPAYLSSQWLADQGFAVVVADGRGTPGRGLAWEKAVRFDLATPALEDQVEALQAAAEAHPDGLDLSRVAIRGWSFGGYLAALAVLRRPDVFHAAIAGAPVADWRLYDTHYTERYLGHPDQHPEAYERSSLLADAAKLERPLLLIHGLADDNVVVAHTLRLSRALLEAGRPHRVLPLTGVTHMTPQEVVAENLLLLQVAFLKEALSASGD